MRTHCSNDSLLFSANAPFIEELYEAYLRNPQSVPPEWHEYFDKLQQTAGTVQSRHQMYRAPGNHPTPSDACRSPDRTG